MINAIGIWLCAPGCRLYALDFKLELCPGSMLYALGSLLHALGSMLNAVCSKLWALGSRLYALGCRLGPSAGSMLQVRGSML